jgi:hypothetical protein
MIPADNPSDAPTAACRGSSVGRLRLEWRVVNCHGIFVHNNTIGAILYDNLRHLLRGVSGREEVPDKLLVLRWGDLVILLIVSLGILLSKGWQGRILRKTDTLRPSEQRPREGQRTKA